MKLFTLLFALIITSAVHSQESDTLSIVKRYKGGTNYVIANGYDTLIYCTYPDGKLESRRSQIESPSYTRYYPNGAVMWQREMEGNLAHGKTIFYSSNGQKIGEFMFANDTVVDTLFLSKKHRFVFGRMTYYSVVYGGMRRPDGQSNTRGGHGIRIHSPMYTVKLNNAVQTQKKYASTITDFNGYFMFVLEKGEFGFFPETTPIEDVSSQLGAPAPKAGNSWNGQWNISGPISFSDQNYTYLHMHYHSVGYAP